MLHDADPRLQAELTYTIDDDGVWLVFKEQRVNLGFGATLEDAILEAERLTYDV